MLSRGPHSFRSYPHAMDSEPGRRIVRREVVRTERVRREVTLRLGSTRAMRLGAKLVFRGLVAKVRRRPVQLTLRTEATHLPTEVVDGADGAAEPSLEPTTTERPDARAT